MDIGSWVVCFILSTVGFCGFAFPSTATRESWPVNLHLASGFGQAMTAILALTGIAFATYQGGLTTALTVVFASSALTYIALRYTGWRAQRLVLGGELILILWAVYSGSEWLWQRLAGH